MHVRDLLIEIAEHGITLTCRHAENRLNARPTATLTPQLIAETTDNREEIIRIMREDQMLKEAGTIQSERKAFELSGKHLDGRGEGGR